MLVVVAVVVAEAEAVVDVVLFPIFASPSNNSLIPIGALPIALRRASRIGLTEIPNVAQIVRKGVCRVGQSHPEEWCQKKKAESTIIPMVHTVTETPFVAEKTLWACA